MYNNPYMANYPSNFNQQSLSERIDGQIAQLQQMKEQMKNQQPAINQTFQLAPNHSGIKYVNSLEEVKRENIFTDTPFFSKDLSVVWLKSANGNIKAYELTEIVEKDSKDMQIEFLQAQIEELRGKIENDTNVTNAYAEQNETDTTADDGSTGNATKKSKPTSVQKISRSKTE